MKSYCLTDVGIKRTGNEDFVYASDEQVGNLPNLFIVADGMGGHNAGEYASRCAVETMVDCIEQSAEKRPLKLLEDAVRAANEQVASKAASSKSLAGMGTTLVACTVVADCLYVANVGDSRLYILDDDEIDQITRDHSLVEEMIRRGELTREEARTHPEKNVITRAVGVKPVLKADFFDVALSAGDRVLLCSDGLTNMLEDKQIYQIAEKQPLEEAGRRLVQQANENGGLDNISVILIEPEVAAADPA